jgi:hypothetical protein
VPSIAQLRYIRLNGRKHRLKAHLGTNVPTVVCFRLVNVLDVMLLEGSSTGAGMPMGQASVEDGKKKNMARRRSRGAVLQAQGCSSVRVR